MIVKGIGSDMIKYICPTCSNLSSNNQFSATEIEILKLENKILMKCVKHYASFKDMRYETDDEQRFYTSIGKEASDAIESLQVYGKRY